MLGRLRSRLPALIGVGAGAEFWAELAFAVPAGTPYRGARGAAARRAGASRSSAGGARRSPARCVGVRRVALLPALSRAYYDELFLPFAMPFVAAYWLGAHALAPRGRDRARRRAPRSACSARCPTTTTRAHRRALHASRSRSSRRSWSAACCAPARRSTARCARRPRCWSATARTPPAAPSWTSGRGSPASCTTSSPTR